jgi:hypothetical protein
MNRRSDIHTILNALAFQPRSEALTTILNFFDDESLKTIAKTLPPQPPPTMEQPNPTFAFLQRLHQTKHKFGVTYEIISVPTDSPFAKGETVADRFLFAITEALP